MRLRNGSAASPRPGAFQFTCLGPVLELGLKNWSQAGSSVPKPAPPWPEELFGWEKLSLKAWEDATCKKHPQWQG